jgi:hypothetical protein
VGNPTPCRTPSRPALSSSSTMTPARAHTRTHVRTHARTHTHTHQPVSSAVFNGDGSAAIAVGGDANCYVMDMSTRGGARCMRVGGWVGAAVCPALWWLQACSRLVLCALPPALRPAQSIRARVYVSFLLLQRRPAGAAVRGAGGPRGGWRGGAALLAAPRGAALLCHAAGARWLLCALAACVCRVLHVSCVSSAQWLSLPSAAEHTESTRSRHATVTCMWVARCAACYRARCV